MQKVSQTASQKMGEQAVENMIESATGGQAEVDIDSDSMTVKTDEGSFSTGTSLPADFPKDAPVYPGSTVTYSGTSNDQEGTTQFAVVLSTNDSNQQVAGYYSTELLAQGWSITSTQNVAGTTAISATKDDRTFSVAAVTEDGITSITLAVDTDSQ